MNKKSKREIGTIAKNVNGLEEGRLTSGLFLKNGNWRKVNGKNATISKIFVDGDWGNILIFNGEIFGGDTPVYNIEY